MDSSQYQNTYTPNYNTYPSAMNDNLDQISPHKTDERTPILPAEKKEKSLCVCYLLAIPFGWLGLHHFYMNRMFFGIVYALSFGLLGIGWIVDLFRMSVLLRRCNAEINRTRRPLIRTLDDAYVLWFPLGLLGYHQFYLRRPLMGLLYKFTLGIFGIGWIVDLFIMKRLVRDANARMDQLINAILNAQPVGNPPPYTAVDVSNGNPQQQDGHYQQPWGLDAPPPLPPQQQFSTGNYGFDGPKPLEPPV